MRGPCICKKLRYDARFGDDFVIEYAIGVFNGGNDTTL